jgi:hydroxymethylglutaryl-CoA lyase
MATTTEHAVKIVEVGPRDGLQNESQPVSTDDKVELIQGLAKAGCSVIEAGAFVSPKWVPQMADSKQVFQRLSFDKGQQRPYLSCLVPNIKGLEQALQVRNNIDEVAIFGAASEAFSQRNIACSIDESLERFRAVVDRANEHNLPVRGYVSTVVGCPYQGEVAPTQVAKVVHKMLELGCYEISLGDTIGVGTPGSVRNMLEEVLVRFLFVEGGHC